MTPNAAPQSPQPAPSTLNRRALLAGSAWAAPVLAVAISAPVAAASGNAIMVFYTTPQMFVHGSTWNPAINGNVAHGYRFETKIGNQYQAPGTSILTTDIVVSYPAAYVADLPLTNLSPGLVELSRVVSGGLITFTLRLTETIPNGGSSSNITWVAAAVPGTPTAQAVNFTAKLTSPQSSTTLTHSGSNPTW